jgi:hypothetical protein
MSSIAENHSQSSARPESSPERYALDLLIVVLKQQAKADAAVIRRARRVTRALQRAGAAEAPRAQSGLATLRREARATLLVYGMARGRPLERIERDRKEADWLLKHQLLAAWRRSRDAVTRISGIEPVTPVQLEPHLPAGSA